MNGQSENCKLSWSTNGVPISDQFDDPYFSFSDGLAETRHVFLGGCDLPARFSEGFTVAELGFGTGLNLLATWAAWEAAGFKTALNFVSFEAFPMDLGDMETALRHWPELDRYAKKLLKQLKVTPDSAKFETLSLKLIIGDARKTLPSSNEMAHAWFLDGFSPAKNPELWEEKLLAEVAAHTCPNGIAATYSAAGHVRQKLSNAGFEVSRIPGFGRKRHMTRAVRL
ncbi:MAG: tRNA (5-methylaminomethyl-2-thiouridine)(34)-methyltransferase MnmD [Pseudomonadota bacterium]